jgi:hypothetical protein
MSGGPRRVLGPVERERDLRQGRWLRGGKQARYGIAGPGRNLDRAQININNSTNITTHQPCAAVRLVAPTRSLVRFLRR